MNNTLNITVDGEALTVIRHSWQIPMPQNGARGSPLTAWRVVGSPVNASAAATLMILGERCPLAPEAWLPTRLYHQEAIA
jgi:hypothetical protein